MSHLRKLMLDQMQLRQKSLPVSDPLHHHLHVLAVEVVGSLELLVVVLAVLEVEVVLPYLEGVRHPHS